MEFVPLGCGYGLYKNTSIALDLQPIVQLPFTDGDITLLSASSST
jgi:hypothetical protein